MPLLKPPRWSWDVSLLEPKFQELARGLQIVVPLWETGDPTELVSRIAAVTGEMSNVVTPHGVGKRIAVNGTTLGAAWASSDMSTWNPNDAGITAAVLVDLESDVGSGGLIAHRTTSSIGMWQLYTQFNDLRFLYKDPSSRTAVADLLANENDVSPIFGAYNLYAYSSPPAAAGQLYRNGVKLLMQSTRTQPPVSVAHQLVIGANNPTGESRQGGYLVAYKWNRPLSDAEHVLLASDPFGLIRPALLETEVAVGQTVTVGIVTETDTAFTIVPVKPIIQTVGLASETDSALTVTPVKPIIQTVGLASELNTAFSISAVKPIIQTVGLASETDTALAINLIRTVGVGIATETDTALGVTVLKPIIQTVGIATEIDTALTVTATGPSVFVSVKGFVSITDTVTGVTMTDVVAGAAIADTGKGVVSITDA